MRSYCRVSRHSKWGGISKMFDYITEWSLQGQAVKEKKLFKVESFPTSGDPV